MGDFFQPWHLILLLIVFSFLMVLYVVPFWFIYKKAGFTPGFVRCALFRSAQSFRFLYSRLRNGLRSDLQYEADMCHRSCKA
ncbi:hypothetical protein [Terracidiphilus gabretensis]|uniref:hypothetical protein n=1 Tax=Terracidiphilus gabretensis TaxID=1577687 RepID=UPI00071B58AC|nr:hypothetical protein [Terracidiphilus gabretensis]